MLVAALRPHLRADAVWFCPVDPFAGTSSRVGRLDHRYSSYRTAGFPSAMLPVPMAVTMEGRPFPGRGTLPAQALLLTDNLWFYDPEAIPPEYSHSGWFNGVFFDGHAKAYAWSSSALEP